MNRLAARPACMLLAACLPLILLLVLLPEPASWAAENEDVEAPDASPALDLPFTQEAPEGKTRASIPEVSFGGAHYVIAENEYHRGDLVLFGGSVEVRGDVLGSLVLIGGRGVVSGTVRGDVVGVASSIDLREGATVRDSVVSVAGSTQSAPGVRIGTGLVNVPFLDLSHFASGGSILSFLLWLAFWIKLLKAAFLFLAVVLLTAIFTERVGFCAGVLPNVAGRSFLWGLLVWVAATLAIIVMALTIVGIPVAILAWFAFKLVWWGGVAAVSCLIGQQVGRNIFGRSLTTFTATLLGFLIVVVVYMIPFVGGLAVGVIGLVGLGLMVTTRLGTRAPNGMFHAAPPGPPAAAGPLPAPVNTPAGPGAGI